MLKSEYPDLTTAQLKSAILNGVDTLTQLNGKIYRPTTGTWDNHNPITDKTITLYFTNNNWSNVKAYLWNDQLTTNNTWPGKTMSYVGLNDYTQPVYSITFNSELYDHVIFNGSGEQTVIIVVGSDGRGYLSWRLA